MRLILFLMSFFIIANSAFAEDFIEGKHYIKLDLPKHEKTLWKVYSVYCPYCYSYDNSVMPTVIPNLPKDAKFEPIYIVHKGQYGKDAGRVLAAMSLIGEKEYKAVESAYYKEIILNKEKNVRDKGSENFINIGLKAANVKLADYQKLVDSGKVDQIMKEWDTKGLPVATKFGVPAFVVNGQYLVLAESVKSLTMFNELIAYLLTK